MLIELSIADAYGVGLEYVDYEFLVHKNNLSGYIKHPSFHTLKPGQYSDDTQMSLAVSEVLLSDDWSREHFADKFVECFKRDPRPGYARMFQAFLESISSGQEFLEKIQPHSDKSGAAMRAPPIGYLKEIQAVKDIACLQGALTHNTPDGLAAAQASALMSHYFIYDLGKAKHLGQYLNDNITSDINWDKLYKDKILAKGWMSVRACVTVLKEYDSLSAILKNICALGGDTDTAAAIGIAAASCSKNIEQDLPTVLYETLENDKFGKDYIVNIDLNLKRKFIGE